VSEFEDWSGLMNVYAMVVAIVAMVVGSRLAMAWIGSRQSDGGSKQELEALRLEVSTLSKRVATLERIAADPERALAQEIDALR
jgi:hypothetical protein